MSGLETGSAASAAGCSLALAALAVAIVYVFHRDSITPLTVGTVPAASYDYFTLRDKVVGLAWSSSYLKFKYDSTQLGSSPLFLDVEPEGLPQHPGGQLLKAKPVVPIVVAETSCLILDITGCECACPTTCRCCPIRPALPQPRPHPPAAPRSITPTPNPCRRAWCCCCWWWQCCCGRWWWWPCRFTNL